MKILNNKDLKYLVLNIFTLTILIAILNIVLTYKQYNDLSLIVNKKIASIIETIISENPEVDTRKIIELLNSDENIDEYKKGEQELEQYGIDINNANYIVKMQNKMKENLIINTILIIVFCILYFIIGYLYIKRRDKKLKDITKYINKIKEKNYELNITENNEDELSNLKNELYKITVMLKEESEISKKDKENLKIFVEDISHQLKPPLTSITIMLDNLKDNPNMNDDTKQKFIFEISKQIDWINWLVISMLKLSKLDANVVNFYEEKVNVEKFINQIIKNLEIPIEIKNQKIVIEGDKETTFIGDYKWQQEAVTNIIKNCIEHNKENGTIFISYEENILFTKITIRDEGEGIVKDDLKHIFERFYKGRNSSENSIGIGLALAKDIIEKNNGLINCKSELNKGTEFIIKYMK